MTMLRIVVVLATLYVVALISLGTAVRRAAPAPSTQTITGLGIGTGGTSGLHGGESGTVYVSGRRLVCDSASDVAPDASVCTLPIAGELLTIRASRHAPGHPDQLGGTCEATYKGESWACWMGSRHVHVHWFAFLEHPLDLTPAQLDGLRQQYWIENLSEGAVLWGVVAVALSAAVLVTLLVAAWLRERGPRIGAVGVVAGLSGLMALFGAFMLALRWTNGLWD